MTDSLQYRPATKSDQHLLYQLYMDPAANPFLVYDEMPEDDFGILYDKLLTEGVLVMATSDGVAVGSYHTYNKEYRQSDTIYLATLVVHPAYRRKGAATALLGHIIGQARKEGKNRIELEVSVNNAHAIAFYMKMGFEIEGTIRQSYKIGKERKYYDDYLMSILL